MVNQDQMLGDMVTTVGNIKAAQHSIADHLAEDRVRMEETQSAVDRATSQLRDVNNKADQLVNSVGPWGTGSIIVVLAIIFIALVFAIVYL